jgi:hypothetical protein
MADALEAWRWQSLAGEEGSSLWRSPQTTVGQAGLGVVLSARCRELRQLRQEQARS